MGERGAEQQERVSEINSLIQTLKDDGFSSKEISDTRHTFGKLYEMRFSMFKALCHVYKECSGKSLKHFDEENDPMYEDSFLAWIDTPKGNVSFHLPVEQWEEWEIPEYDHGPEYDGYSTEEMIDRFDSLSGGI